MEVSKDSTLEGEFAMRGIQDQSSWLKHWSDFLSDHENSIKED